MTGSMEGRRGVGGREVKLGKWKGSNSYGERNAVIVFHTKGTLKSRAHKCRHEHTYVGMRSRTHA